MEHPRSLRLLENNRGHFFFIITRMVSGAATPEAVTTNAGNRHLTVALDPGVRTFQTAYDADGRAIHFGEGAGHKLERMFAHADRLQGKWKAAEHGSKAAKVLYHKWRRCMSKVTRRVRSMHQRTAAWLLSNYRVVLVSNMNTSAMVRTGGILRPATRRGMLQLSHYRFRQVLLSMARRYKDCRVIEVSEHYTSMSCGACGMKNRGLYGSKTFVCPYCNFECDRDVNGARNILLKYLCDAEIPLANGTPLPGAKERRAAKPTAKRQAAKRKTAPSSQTQGAAKRK
jgi:putative transposase